MYISARTSIRGGNKTMSASERWWQKKAGQDDGQQGNQQQLTDLTELANRLLTETGNMDIYQESYEHISKLIEDSERKNVKKESRSAINYDDALDMYAEDFDEKEKARLEKKKEGVSSAGTGEENGNRVDDTSRSAHKESEDSRRPGIPLLQEKFPRTEPGNRTRDLLIWKPAC
ncbi:CD2 antigen cytoplasmic tail-binding protein 2 homolog isoform X1 [Periplaneta americana]|uniref:CD2 antigen cytoplasmic tail-binding protein 2 homolog isoform X1 n=2 Tax=Periplaneta americana TaxID=6978 RepID=UPI0037E8F723